MAKSKFSRFITRFITVVLAVILVLGIAGLCVYNFVIIPQYNELLSQGEKKGEKLTNRDILTFAKLATDKQLISNLVNIDKQTAKDVLGAMLELEKDIESEATPAPTPKPTPQVVVKDKVFTQVEKSKVTIPTPTPKPTPTPFVPPEIPDDVPATKEQKSAYERIKAAATKEEIQTGLAIIAKVDLKKVSSLNREGKTAELKKYIKSVLTSSEITTSLKLYRKYKHLL